MTAFFRAGFIDFNPTIATGAYDLLFPEMRSYAFLLNASACELHRLFSQFLCFMGY